MELIKNFLGSSSAIADICKKEINDRITEVFSYLKPILYDIFCFLSKNVFNFIIYTFIPLVFSQAMDNIFWIIVIACFFLTSIIGLIQKAYKSMKNKYNFILTFRNEKEEMDFEKKIEEIKAHLKLRMNNEQSSLLNQLIEQEGFYPSKKIKDQIMTVTNISGSQLNNFLRYSRKKIT